MVIACCDSRVASARLRPAVGELIRAPQHRQSRAAHIRPTVSTTAPPPRSNRGQAAEGPAHHRHGPFQLLVVCAVACNCVPTTHWSSRRRQSFHRSDGLDILRPGGGSGSPDIIRPSRSPDRAGKGKASRSVSRTCWGYPFSWPKAFDAGQYHPARVCGTDLAEMEPRDLRAVRSAISWKKA